MTEAIDSRYRLSLSAFAMEATSTELIHAAGAAGFDAVGLALNTVRRSALPERFSDVIPVATLKRDLRDTGLKLLVGYVIVIEPETVPTAFSSLLDVGAELGCEHFQVLIDDPEERRGLGNFVRLCELARPLNQKLSIEFKDDCTVNTIGRAAQIVTESRQANAGITLDFFHFSRSGGKLADLQAIDLKSIYIAELSDAPRQIPPPAEIRKESRTGRRYPGDGELPLTDFLDILPENIPLNVETSGAADPRLSPKENAVIAMKATRRFLGTYRRSTHIA